METECEDCYDYEGFMFGQGDGGFYDNLDFDDNDYYLKEDIHANQDQDLENGNHDQYSNRYIDGDSTRTTAVQHTGWGGEKKN